MNKSILFTALVLSSAVLPAVAAPVFTIDNAVVTEKLTVSGCRAVTFGGLGDVVFDDDGTFVLTRSNMSDSASRPDLVGSWVGVPADAPTAIYMLLDDASVADTFDLIDTQILANCQLNPKYATADVELVRPSVLTKKNMLSIKGTSAKSAFQLSGKQENTFKGTTKYGSFGATITLDGNLVAAP